MMRNKLGLEQEHADEPLLIQQLLNAFSHTETDMTLFFRQLAEIDFSSEIRVLPSIVERARYDTSPPIEARVALLGWLQRYQQRLQMEARPADVRKAGMNRVNPLYVPRNYLAQLAIDAATAGDVSKLEEWMRSTEAALHRASRQGTVLRGSAPNGRGSVPDVRCCRAVH